MKNFDINVDVGEGYLIENDLMPLIQSCNIACGGHAGSDIEIIKCISLAKIHQVKIGAHPSYPDKENFGRTSIQIDEKSLAISIENQLIRFIRHLKSLKDLHHIKPHGALYNDCFKDKKIAKIFINVVLKVCPEVILFTLPESELERQAKKKGIKVWREAFLDRGYKENGQLQEREKPGAIISDVSAMHSQLKGLINKNKLQTIKGDWISIKADTICFHGDHPNVLYNIQELLKLYNI
jgi:UPF0271 protein